MPISKFTHGQPFTATEDDVNARWGFAAPGEFLRCAWCGHRFEVGDCVRWVFTNTGEELCKGIGGNPFICAPCDGPREQILARLQALRRQYDQLYWWFHRR